METNNFDEQQSLELITRMIRNTRQRIDQNAGRPFLIFGYLTVITSLFEYFVHVAHLSMLWSWAWFAIPILGWAIMLLFPSKSKNLPKTDIDRIIGCVWLVFSISIVFAFAAAIAYKVSIFFLITLLMGMATAITGLIARHTVCTVLGFVSMCLSFVFIAMRDVVDTNHYTILIYAAIFVIMMVIPGHVLRYRARRQCSKS